MSRWKVELICTSSEPRSLTLIITVILRSSWTGMSSCFFFFLLIWFEPCLGTILVNRTMEISEEKEGARAREGDQPQKPFAWVIIRWFAGNKPFFGLGWLIAKLLTSSLKFGDAITHKLSISVVVIVCNLFLSPCFIDPIFFEYTAII